MANTIVNWVDRAVREGNTAKDVIQSEVSMREAIPDLVDDDVMYVGTLLSFPVEILELIFSYLGISDSGRCAQVCSRFRSIMYANLSDIAITRNTSCRRDYPPPSSRIRTKDLRPGNRFMFDLYLRRGNMLPSCNINLRVHKSLNRFYKLQGGYHLRSTERVSRMHFAISVLVRGHTFPKEITFETDKKFSEDSPEYRALEAAKEHITALFVDMTKPDNPGDYDEY